MRMPKRVTHAQALLSRAMVEARVHPMGVYGTLVKTMNHPNNVGLTPMLALAAALIQEAHEDIKPALRRIAAKGGGRVHRGATLQVNGPDGKARCVYQRKCAICIARNTLWRLR